MKQLARTRIPFPQNPSILYIGNSHVSIVPFDYTAAALSSLNNKEVDSVLVGRLAENSELNDTFKMRLKEGLTLVGKQKKMINVNEFLDVKIYTYVSQEKAREYFPESAISEGSK